MTWRIERGDCIEVMRTLDDASIDAVICDPPYGLGFMGAAWDTLDGRTTGIQRRDIRTRFDHVGGNHHPVDAADAARTKGVENRKSQAWHKAWAVEALRVLKSGGHLLAFGGTRTYHRLACAIEDAGFEIRDSFLYWGYGSGFPKSLSPYRSMLSERCPSHASAKHAVPISPPTRARSNGAKVASVPALVETHPEGELGLLIPTGAVDGSSEAMVIGPSALRTAGMNLSTVQSWQASSDVILNGTNMSITETVTRLTTDPRILNSCRSLPTPPSIIQDEWRPDGCSCDALPVIESSSVGEWKWSDTPLLTARAPVIAPIAPLKGLGTAAKPSYEPIVVARKPLTGTVAANVLAHGTGALNVDGCRVGTAGENFNRPAVHNGEHDGWDRPWKHTTEGMQRRQVAKDEAARKAESLGRWPANVILDPEAAAMLDEQTGDVRSAGEYVKGNGTQGDKVGAASIPIDGLTSATYADSGGASRFFLTAGFSTLDAWPQPGDASTRDASTSAGSRTESNDDSSPIDGSGSKPTDQSPADTTSTTETTTDSTTNSPISNSSNVDGTKPITGNSEPQRLSETVSDDAHAAESGSRSMPTPSDLPRHDSPIAASAGPLISENGEQPTASITTPTCVPIDSEPTERFRYCAKASSAERNAGLDGFEEKAADERHAMSGLTDLRMDREQERRVAKNVHPTVKPIDLMRWLCRLVTPPSGLIIDPFAGSGTTGCAAVLEGFRFVGIECESEYADIAEARIAWWAEHPDGMKLVDRLEAERQRKTVAESGQLEMFG